MVKKIYKQVVILVKMNERMKKVKYFLRLKKMVHVMTTKGNFYNGIIKSIDEDEDLFIIKDRMLGDLPVYFTEVSIIEPFRLRRYGE